MPTQLTQQTGLLITPTANAADATGNYVVPADSKQDLSIRITNGSASSITVTLDDVNSVAPEGTAITTAYDPVLTIPAAASRYFNIDARINLARFLNPANGRVSWSYSAATSVTVEVTAS